MVNPRDEAFQPIFPTPVVLTDLPDGGILVSPESGAEVCDFCTGPDPTWEYPCQDFQSSPFATSLGSWAACEACALLIEAGDWDELRDRALAGAPKIPSIAPDDPRSLTIMAEIHQEFRANRNGERKRYE